MRLSVIQDGEIENEFNLFLCCEEDGRERYGFNSEQFHKLTEYMKKKEAFPVPAHINTQDEFVAYVKTLKF